MLAAHEVYRSQLSDICEGVALYDPDPAGDYDHVRIGDVGHLKRGRFLRAFNIFFPAGDEVNSRGVPTGFVPLPEDVKNDTYRETPFPPGTICSKHVKREIGGEVQLTGCVRSKLPIGEKL